MWRVQQMPAVLSLQLMTHLTTTIYESLNPSHWSHWPKAIWTAFKTTKGLWWLVRIVPSQGKWKQTQYPAQEISSRTYRNFRQPLGSPSACQSLGSSVPLRFPLSYLAHSVPARTRLGSPSCQTLLIRAVFSFWNVLLGMCMVNSLCLLH